MAERRSKQSRRKPSFFWQGVLILAPVLVLAKLGAYALWRDERLALREAEVRAQELAEEAAGRIWDELEKVHLPAILFDSSGNLVRPKPYDPIPIPHPLNEAQLNAEQRDLWHRTRQVSEDAQGRNAARLYEQFLQSNPPRSFAAVAHFNRGLMLERTGQPATQEFVTITNQYADVVSEAGLPLDFLARLHLQSKTELLRYAIENPSPLTPQIVAQFSDSATDAPALWAEQEQLRHLAGLARPFFRTNRVNRFGSFTNLADSMEWQVDAPPIFWETNYDEPLAQPPGKASRFPSVGRSNKISKLFWTSPPNTGLQTDGAKPVTASDELNIVMVADKKHQPSLLSTNFDRSAASSVSGRSWLLMRLLPARDSTITTNGFLLLAQPEEEAFDALRAALSNLSKPDWLDFTVGIAGHDAVTTNELLELNYVQGGKGGGQFWKRAVPQHSLDVLASATRAERGNPGVTVTAVLVSRDLLLAQQKAHALWFGFIVAAAALASVLGFASAYRAFHKQHRLAELKSNFVSGVSHELRAPIASIRLMAEGLERGKISEEGKQHEYFRFIGQECRRLSSMIENVLDFARIEEGRKQYEFEPVDVRALVAQTVKLMEPYAAERSVRLVTKIELQSSQEARGITQTNDASGSPPSPPAAGGEEGRSANEFIATIDGQAIQQALVNLIDNAIKHSPEGQEVIVRIGRAGNGSPLTPALSPLRGEGEQGATAGAILRLSVQDYGRGIPASEHEKIFERFYRIGSELRRETPGVGIGLSIVKHIVEAHNGRIRVESEPGKGSRFIIELPMNGTTTKGGAK